MSVAFSSPDTSSNLAFVYGTLQVPAVLEHVLGRVPAIRPAVLAGYRRGRVLGQSYPAIVAAVGATVGGALLLDVNSADWERLDAYEGQLYARCSVSVIFDQHQCPAHCYVLRPEYAHLFDPTPWSLEDFLEGDLTTFLCDLD